MSIKLENIKVESGQYMRPLWQMYFRRNWPWFLLPLVVCGIGGLLMHDVRWLVVGLMLVFMVFPMLMILIYINYALTLEVRWSLMEKTVEIDKEGLHLTFTDQRMKSRNIAWHDIKMVTRDDRYYYFHLRVRPYNFLLIPRESLVSQGVNEKNLLMLVHSESRYFYA